MKTYYLHTIDDKPAFFTGTMICFCARTPQSRRSQPLCTSLKQVKREQHASRVYRARRDYPEMQYGYVLVTAED